MERPQLWKRIMIRTQTAQLRAATRLAALVMGLLASATATYDVSTGHASGGVVNATMRSGTNALSGDFKALVRDIGEE
jgi:hypothetical protein